MTVDRRGERQGIPCPSSEAALRRKILFLSLFTSSYQRKRWHIEELWNSFPNHVKYCHHNGEARRALFSLISIFVPLIPFIKCFTLCCTVLKLIGTLQRFWSSFHIPAFFPLFQSWYYRGNKSVLVRNTGFLQLFVRLDCLHLECGKSWRHR